MTDTNGWPDASKPDARSTQTHEVKCWPAYFRALADGRKAFELRRDDRDYRAGDTLYVREWCPVLGNYTGRAVTFGISYVLRKHPEFGLEDGFAILSLIPIEAAAREQASYQQGWRDREDDFIAGTERSGLIVMAPSELAARVAAAVTAEREACAGHAEGYAIDDGSAPWRSGQEHAAHKIARRIRGEHRPAPSAVEPSPCATVNAVREDLRARAEFGLKKYGQTVADNPADLLAWLQHAYEEALDMAVYLRRAIEQRQRDEKEPKA